MTAERLRRAESVVVAGLGLGDEGKGATVDWLSTELGPSLVVRFNGGAQAAHNVVVEGKHHCFHQFGSGTLTGANTFLSRYSIIDPAALWAEAQQLEALGVVDSMSRIMIDPDALVVASIHAAANRTREDLRGSAPHGSCGMGIGETTWYDLAVTDGARAGQTYSGFWTPSDAEVPALRVRDCASATMLRRKLDALARFYQPLLSGGNHEVDSVAEIASMLGRFANMARIAGPEVIAQHARHGPVIFEAAQGALLDEWRGWHPHTTWSTTTPHRAHQLAAVAGLARPYVVGVMRTYATRHGAGPMPTEDNEVGRRLPEAHNATGRYQGQWRAGHLDLPALRYGVDICDGIDAIALTHVDAVHKASDVLQVAVEYVDADGAPLALTPVRGDRNVDVVEKQVTDVARRAIPVVRPIAGSVPALVRRVEEHLGAPVIALSDGPRRSDRAWRVAAMGTGSMSEGRGLR